MVLPQTTLFPGATHPLRVSQASHIKLIADALEGDRCFVLANQSQVKNIPCKVCGIGLIRAAMRTKNSYLLILQGLARVSLEHRLTGHPYPVYQVSPLVESSRNSKNLQLLAEQLKQKVAQVVRKMDVKSFGIISEVPSAPVKENPEASIENFLSYLKQIKQPGILADLVASTLIIPGQDRQTLLNVCSVSKRLQTAIEIFCKTYGLAF